MYLSRPYQFNKNLRLATAFVAALIVSFCLFYLMNVMISSHGAGNLISAKTNIINFIRLNNETDAQHKKRQRTEPKKNQRKAPSRPSISSLKNKQITTEINLKMPIPESVSFSVQGSPVIGEIGQELTNDQLIPVTRIAPEYPRKAALKKIEGWVKLEFTVQGDGSVTDIKIIDSKPRRVFNRAAIKAISKWKFKPVSSVATAGKRFNQVIEFKLNHD